MTTKHLILFLGFASSIGSAVARTSLPVGYNYRGSPFVNFTISGVGLPSNFTLPMILKFSDTNVVGFSGSPDAQVHLRLNGSGVINITDPSIYFHGGFGPESVLTIGKGGWIRNTYGSIAFIGNALVLNASRDDFVSSCSSESYISAVTETGSSAVIGFDQLTGSIRTQHHLFVAPGIHFELRSLQDGIVGSIPDTLLVQIEQTLISNGVIRLIGGRNRYRFGGSNCDASSLADLPTVIFAFGSSGGELVLTPEDYIQLHPERNECALLLRGPAPDVVGGQYFFDPFMIKGLNFRISNDFFEICDAI